MSRHRWLEPGSPRLSWRYIVAAGGLEYVVFKMMDPFYLQYLTTSHGLGLSPARFGWFVGLSSGTGFLLDYLTGFLADRLGRVRCWAASLGVYGTAMLVLPLARSFALVLLAAVLMGVSTALASGAQQAWLYDAVGQSRFRRTLALLYMWSLPLTGGGIALGIALGFGGSLRLPLFVAAGCCFVLAAYVLLRLPENRSRRAATARHEPFLARFTLGARLVSRQPVLWLTALQSLIFVLPTWITSAWWITYLSDHFGFSLDQTVLAFAVTSVTAAAAGYLIGKIETDNYALLILAPAAAVVALWCVALLIDRAVVFIAAITAILGLSTIKSVGVQILENSRITTERAASLSFLNTIRSLGWIIGPPLIGLIINRTGYRGLLTGAAVASIIGLALLVAALRVARRTDGPRADVDRASREHNRRDSGTTSDRHTLRSARSEGEGTDHDAQDSSHG